MIEEVLKTFSKLGANGIILVMVWSVTLAMSAVGKLPAPEGSGVLLYKTGLQYMLGTLVVIVVSMFVTWNVWGWPKRLMAESHG